MITTTQLVQYNHNIKTNSRKLLIEDYERSQSRHSVSCGGGSRAAVNKSMLVAGHGREWFTSGTGYGRQHSGSRWTQMETIAHNIHDVMSSSAIMGALQQTVSSHDGCIVAPQCIIVFIINWLCYYRQYKIRKQASSREGVR